MVQTGAVNVQATVIEKTVSHTKTNFKKIRRKQYQKIHCKFVLIKHINLIKINWFLVYRMQQTMLRINEIQIVDEIDNPPDVSIGTTRV